MKLKFANGHSFCLWETEFISIQIDRAQLSYVRPDNRRVVIRLPEDWLKGCPIETSSHNDITNSSRNIGSEKRMETTF